MDVQGEPPDSLLDAMRASAARDMIAAEYAGGFTVTLKKVAPRIVAARANNLTLPQAIVYTQVQLLADFGDSLIARKSGQAVNEQCVARAARVLQAGAPHDENYRAALADFDFWLRSDGRRRNPGTTADLIAAGLFVCLRDRLIAPPFG
jgi:triphosphoribosyl-dephospho-CoA synthase